MRAPTLLIALLVAASGCSKQPQQAATTATITGYEGEMRAALGPATNGALIDDVSAKFGPPDSTIPLGGGTSYVSFVTVGISNLPPELVGFSAIVVNGRVVRINLTRRAFSPSSANPIRSKVLQAAPLTFAFGDAHETTTEFVPESVLGLNPKTNAQGKIFYTTLRIDLKAEDAKRLFSFSQQFPGDSVRISRNGKVLAEPFLFLDTPPSEGIDLNLPDPGFAEAELFR